MNKILFVEDEAAIQKTLGEALRKKGYDVHSALDGEAGLSSARSEKPDLILFDLILPKKHGLEVLEELRKDDSTKDIPVIILTNVASVSKQEEGQKTGQFDYCVKTDYNLVDIVKKIKEKEGF